MIWEIMGRVGSRSSQFTPIFCELLCVPARECSQNGRLLWLFSSFISIVWSWPEQLVLKGISCRLLNDLSFSAMISEPPVLLCGESCTIMCELITVSDFRLFLNKRLRVLLCFDNCPFQKQSNESRRGETTRKLSDDSDWQRGIVNR